MKRLSALAAPLAVSLTIAALTTSPCVAQLPGGLGLRARANARQLEGVTAHRDVAYVKSGHERQKLDIYVPESSEPLPVLIWVHGGGWQGGSKDGCPPLRSGYTQKGYAVASIGYRLSGDAKFPAQIEDCKSAIRWLRAHAEEFNLDPERFGVWGSSAGGHLVALLGTSGDVKEFEVGESLDQSSRVQAVCDFYGPTDLNVFVSTPGYESHASMNSPESKLIGGLVADHPEVARKINPITFVSDDDPPFLIVHGDKDGTVPINQSKLLFDAFKKTGVAVHFHTIHGAGHGGPGFNEPTVEDMVSEFFETKLKANAENPATPKATQSESTASVTAQRPGMGTQRGGGLTWANVTSRMDTDRDGKISRDEFRGGDPLWKRLDKDDDGYITQDEHESAFESRMKRE
ncbi:alpha/beta hydrolase fold domain-containing protein [Aporhodopirellula aestuarii]|uniref:Alpha/beta hydrolase fold domain-containing protein n=1 Tax=Aporhodopirellula aestuarii TaxID=2950107 RepID=A0ABT0U0A7_9BACT|nr:alpha/beta hydrolase fold domain-containing protein [Aporhodopirellula aestuarii]MCM2370275.1 alpha/beta hydrolase fold domain-containing protein [Aporhodopirellula aestuarii]